MAYNTPNLIGSACSVKILGSVYVHCTCFICAVNRMKRNAVSVCQSVCMVGVPKEGYIVLRAKLLPPTFRSGLQ